MTSESKKSVIVPTDHPNAIEKESGHQASHHTIEAHPGTIGIASLVTAKLMPTNVAEQNSSQPTRLPGTVPATMEQQFAKWENTKELHLAVERGDIPAIKELIQLGADVNVKNSKNEAPLMIAATSKVDGNTSYNIVKYLIDHGSDAFDTDSEGHTFLHKLCLKTTTFKSGIGAFIRYLVDKKLANLFNTQNTTFGRTPLMLVARSVELDMATISLLKENGVDLTLVDKNGASYLSYAAEGDKNQKLLVELMRSGEIKHNKLAEAIQAMDVESAKVLVRLGADVNETYEQWRTPLHLAALSPMAFAVNIIRFLIDSGANVDFKDIEENIFLHLLIRENTTINPTEFDDMATYLISKGLSRIFNTPNLYLRTPFHYAVQYVEIERATLTVLKSNGVDFNAVGRGGYSVLFYASEGKRTLRMISDLVDLGANPNHLTACKESMLHVAVLDGNAQVVKFFLDKGLYINAEGTNRRTPLHWALDCVNKADVLKIDQLLLQSDAKSDVVDNKGKSPRDYLNENRNKYPDADKISTCFLPRSSC